MNDLLNEYIRTGSSEAFGRIVRAYTDVIYTQSLREMRDPSLAEEVTQQVFITLARKARKISDDAVLAGWLFNTTRHRSSYVRRTEFRRRKHEREAMKMRKQIERGDSDNEMQSEAEPLLNNAIAGLRSKDREAILLKFFHGRSMRQVGAAMGISEDAAKQRVSRAVDKLRRWFAGEGLVVPSGMIVAWLGEVVKPAPAHVALKISALPLSKPGIGIWNWMGAKIGATVVLGAMVVATVPVSVKLIADAGSPPVVMADDGPPATQRATVGSQGTPIDTLKKLSAALHHDDRAAVDACLTDDGTDPEMAAVVRAHFHEAGAWSHVLAVSRNSFKRDDIPLQGVNFTMFPHLDGGYEALIDKMLEKGDSGVELKTEGETARVRVSVPKELFGGTGMNRARWEEHWSGATFLFQKVDGDWKLDTSRSINLIVVVRLQNKNADEMKASRELLEMLADAMAEGATQIESGQLATPEAAGAAIERMSGDAFRACKVNMINTNALPIVGG